MALHQLKGLQELLSLPNFPTETIVVPMLAETHKYGILDHLDPEKKAVRPYLPPYKKDKAVSKNTDEHEDALNAYVNWRRRRCKGVRTDEDLPWAPARNQIGHAVWNFGVGSVASNSMLSEFERIDPDDTTPYLYEVTGIPLPMEWDYLQHPEKPLNDDHSVVHPLQHYISNEQLPDVLFVFDPDNLTLPDDMQNSASDDDDDKIHTDSNSDEHDKSGGVHSSKYPLKAEDASQEKVQAVYLQEASKGPELANPLMSSLDAKTGEVAAASADLPRNEKAPEPGMQATVNAADLCTNTDVSLPANMSSQPDQLVKDASDENIPVPQSRLSSQIVRNEQHGIHASSKADGHMKDSPLILTEGPMLRAVEVGELTAAKPKPDPNGSTIKADLDTIMDDLHLPVSGPENRSPADDAMMIDEPGIETAVPMIAEAKPISSSEQQKPKQRKNSPPRPVRYKRVDPTGLKVPFVETPPPVRPKPPTYLSLSKTSKMGEGHSGKVWDAIVEFNRNEGGDPAAHASLGSALLPNKLSVAAKIPFSDESGRAFVQNEARVYALLPPTLSRTYNGYTMSPRARNWIPRPTVAVFPKFYGYYAADRDDDKKNASRNPILLMEKCGSPVVVTDHEQSHARGASPAPSAPPETINDDEWEFKLIEEHRLEALLPFLKALLRYGTLQRTHLHYASTTTLCRLHSELILSTQYTLSAWASCSSTIKALASNSVLPNY